jgi:hypothetical protein
MLGIEAPVCFFYFLSLILESLYNLARNLVEGGDHVNPVALDRRLSHPGDDRRVLVLDDDHRDATIVPSSLHQISKLFCLNKWGFWIVKDTCINRKYLPQKIY